VHTNAAIMPRATLSQYIFVRGCNSFSAFPFYIFDYDLKLSIYSLVVVINSWKVMHVAEEGVYKF
jgi:hypothetical protein